MGRTGSSINLYCLMRDVNNFVNPIYQHCWEVLRMSLSTEKMSKMIIKGLKLNTCGATNVATN